VINIREIFQEGKKMAKESILGTVERLTKEAGKMIK